jgi:hypothetical protein
VDDTQGGASTPIHIAIHIAHVPIQVYYITSCVNGVFNGWLVNEWSGAGVPLYVNRRDGRWLGWMDDGLISPPPPTHPPFLPTHSSQSCSNMTGTVNPQGDIAVVVSTNGAWSTPWPKARVMRKAGKLRTLVQATIGISPSSFVVHGPTWMTVISPKDKEWSNLPGNPGSVPDFVALCGHVV